MSAAKTNFAEVSKTNSSSFIRGNNLPELHLRTSTLRYFTSPTPPDPSQQCHVQNRLLSCNTLRFSITVAPFAPLARPPNVNDIQNTNFDQCRPRKRISPKFQNQLLQFHPREQLARADLRTSTFDISHPRPRQTLHNSVTFRTAPIMQHSASASLLLLLRRLRGRRTSTTSKTPTLINVGRRKTNFSRSFKTNSSSFIRGNNLPELHLRTSTLRYFTSPTPHRPFTTVSRSESACLSCNTPLQVIVFILAPLARCRATPVTKRSKDTNFDQCRPTKNEFQPKFQNQLLQFHPREQLARAALANADPSIFHIVDPAQTLRQHCHAQIALPFATDHQKTTDA